VKPTEEWPVAFFDDEYLRIYLPQFTEERTAAEAEFIQSSLALPPGATLLDLACGVGRHAIPMAKRGFRVTGVDFNPRYLEIAAREAKLAGVELEWAAIDMRSLEWSERFDGAYSFFTSFGYYSDEENEAVLSRIARALKPGGRLLLDMMNRDWMLTHPLQRTWNQREDGALIMEEVSMDLVTSRVKSRITLIEPSTGALPAKEFDLRAYTCAELTALLARHGLAVRETWGGADRTAYSTESRRLVIVAERRAAGAGRAG
jgi:cyclopropane fatty-acyl-phospholipid synthase-like methyltransferase